MRAQFVLSEIGIGLRRNLTMTIAVVLTTAISLVLLGAGILINKQVSVMKDYWYDKVQVSVFLCADNSTAPTCASKAVTQEQRDVLSVQLRAMPIVKNVFYESKTDAFARFKEQFKDSPDLVDSVTADALPESYRVQLRDATKFDVVASALRDQPGVDTVSDQRKLVEPLFNLLSKLRLISWLVAGLQVVAALLLISNTIRVAAFSRRRETGIMRLVGASNLYIQLPFLLEGVLAGLVGSVFAVGGVVLMKFFLIDQVLKPSLKFTAFIGWDAVFSTIPWLILVGVLLSGLSSFVTLRRHLRV